MPNGLESKPVEVKPVGKRRVQSKTYWFGGILVFLAAVLQLPEVNELILLLPESWQSITLGAIGIVVMVLREITKEPIVKAMAK